MLVRFILLIVVVLAGMAPTLAPVHARQDTSEAIDAARPSVVTVYTYRPGGTFTPGGSGRAPNGSGSGWAWSHDGLIVTNAHVVDEAREITVVTVEGKLIEASVLGSDWYQDVAVLQLDPDRRDDFPPPITVGTSSSVEPSQAVAAIGTPHGQFLDTVSQGEVLGIDQRINTGQGYSILNLIQHSATLRPGNSGGPLVDENGAVIGMNVASRTVTSARHETIIGFAIAIDTVVSLAHEILDNGTVSRPWLGVTTTLADGQTVVAGIEPDSPAANAGLREGDRLLQVDDEEITWSTPFIDLLYLHAPGDTLVLRIDRNGDRLEVEVRLEARDSGG